MASDRLVLDASYALEAILPTSSQWQLEALALIDRIAGGDVDAQVPWIFFAEVAATVTRKTRGRQLDVQRARVFLETIDTLSLQVDAARHRSLAMHDAALRWHAGAADAVYLDLAVRLAVPVATRDRGMLTAARSAGLAVY